MIEAIDKLPALYLVAVVALLVIGGIILALVVDLLWDWKWLPLLTKRAVLFILLVVAAVFGWITIIDGGYIYREEVELIPAIVVAVTMLATVGALVMILAWILDRPRRIPVVRTTRRKLRPKRPGAVRSFFLGRLSGLEVLAYLVMVGGLLYLLATGVIS